MKFERSSGILLHPTSFPSRHGIGDLGEHAYHFVDFLAGAGQTLWQVLPLGPTGYADSPYQCFSAFAGNPMLISLDRLAAEGYLDPADLADSPDFPAARVDYGPVIRFKRALLQASFEHFQAHATPAQREAFERFCQENAAWLDDFALFMALKDQHGGGPWIEWEPDIALRQPQALERWEQELAEPVELHKYLQHLFFKQWLDLKAYANERRIRIIGDIPIFVAYDSADVWANPELFYLDEQGQLIVVAGVPPDYFSQTGQLWGNPLYRWQALAETGYAWWIERFRASLTLVDVVRVDHFRGFAAYWEVPAEEDTAINGRWVRGPGADLFKAVEEALGELPILAEDLGVITPDVIALRDRFGFPGMNVLQFAWGESKASENRFLPHNHEHNSVVYTGTHDNDTTLGWYQNADPSQRDHVRRYLRRDGSDISWDMVRLALSSVADMAVVPLQDLMGLGSEARMNYPSVPSGNWTWRYTPDQLTGGIKQGLIELTELYGRWPLTEEEKPQPVEIEVEDPL